MGPKCTRAGKEAAEWIRDFPVVWNVGMGPAGGSFLRTGLLFERTDDIYGPYDHVTRVILPPEAASSTAHHLLAFEVLVEMARTLVGDEEEEVQELKRLAAQESYFGYGTISDNLVIKAFGSKYGFLLSVDDAMEWDIAFDRRPSKYSLLLEGIHKAMQAKRHLLLLENLHVPITLDVLLLITNGRWPSAFHNRWLISATSRDVCEKSRQQAHPIKDSWRLSPEHYHAPNLDDLQRDWDWAVLLKEALRDAAASIHHQHQQQQEGHDEDSWRLVAQHCFFYAILYHPLQEAAAGRQAWNTADELVRCWVAEDLILSRRSPTDMPTTATTANNNYRSAYEAGKVIIRALQEYSLLPPIYSVSDSPTIATTTSSSASISSKDVAEGVHRLQQDQLFDQEKIHTLRWVSFMNDDGRHRWAKLIPGEMNMTSLILRGCSYISRFPFSTLRLLSLRGCTNLETLSAPPDSPTTSEQQPRKPPLTYLENLQVLDINGVPLLEITQQDGSNKSNLHFLDLSGSRLTTLPSDFFCEMSFLEELILGNCLHLKELPPSLAKLHNLLILHTDTFQAMERLNTLNLMNNTLLMSLPMSLSQAKGLRELHISNCTILSLEPLWELLSFLEDLCIQTWEALVDIRIHGHPNLRSFSLSGPWVRFLSLRGCGKLKFVNFNDVLTALEVVDLSDTALEEVPHSLPNLPRLRKLLLLNVPCFMRFPWHQLVRFPKVFYLDHSAAKTSLLHETYADENQHEVNETSNTARININNPKMFYSFNTDAAHKLVMNEQFLQSFNVQVKPSHVKSLEPKKKKANCIAAMMKLQPRRRHVEISTNNRYAHGLKHLLSVTESMFITDDSTIRCLSELNYSMVYLEECQLIHCNEMKVFLNNLLRLVEPSDVNCSYSITLKLLKQIHLEHRPRLEELFPSVVELGFKTRVVVAKKFNMEFGKKNQ
ncbi:hypothetical protein BS78_05G079800 [Paspalum vaginatum]|nr:hypothetical protein BS78_05G079800 [Paspalum vaginatum]